MSVAEPLEQEGLQDNKFTAIYIAVLAVLIAICSIGDDDASKTMIRSSVGAADTYAFFQAKNIRQTAYALSADEFEAELLKPGLDENTRKFLQDKLGKYRATVDRYESEPATGDGKKELLAKARGLEAERDLALRRDPYFDYGQGLLQIAIVLASASLILGGTILLWVSGVMGIVGALSTINAFALLVELPFLS
jgi:hypothetical protein